MKKRAKKVQAVQLKGRWIFQPEDEQEAHRLMASLDICLALWDIQMWLRDKTKYGHEYKTADEVLDAAYEQYFNILRTHGVNLDELMS